MISYTLLIVIAIALSILVYTYLKGYVPGERMECSPDISLTLEQASCNIAESKLSITLANRGLFNVDGVYIRVGSSDNDVRTQINKENELFPSPLAPNEERVLANINFNQATTGVTAGAENTIEIQPAILEDGFLVPCDQAVVTYQLTCS